MSPVELILTAWLSGVLQAARALPVLRTPDGPSDSGMHACTRDSRACWLKERGCVVKWVVRGRSGYSNCTRLSTALPSVFPFSLSPSLSHYLHHQLSYTLQKITWRQMRVLKDAELPVWGVSRGPMLPFHIPFLTSSVSTIMWCMVITVADPDSGRLDVCPWMTLKCINVGR